MSELSDERVKQLGQLAERAKYAISRFLSHEGRYEHEKFQADAEVGEMHAQLYPTVVLSIANSLLATREEAKRLRAWIEKHRDECRESAKHHERDVFAVVLNQRADEIDRVLTGDATHE